MLDPAANVRALGDAQRRGFEAARRLADRIAPIVDEARAPRTDGAEPEEDPDPTSGDGLLEELFRSWAELTVRVMAGLAEGRQPRSAPVAGDAAAPTVSVDLSDDQDRAGLHLTSDPAGRLTAAPELWLHNRTARPIGPVRITVDDLCTPTGETLDGDRIRFDPKDLDGIPPRSARGLVVAIVEGRPLEPGSYRGSVRIDGVPDRAVPLRIDVRKAHR